ncbi:dolichyl pyrophosphate Glc1Man9GlcNAc2 alpha-1,3-glucosyltransferase-like [Thraustotheca clavata]|uniref:Alpha-1,3-glucosyltransferase n=1 Tax=Thraustotheca clavata TaxID=74557 RepID=A0A1V9ZZ13_9STRA|nr:dolichyl pyrophosphate Glc1Man9GlcNAc2 alpha-1,3-glucosyltransferase-like [Thraustotheca clavata]
MARAKSSSSMKKTTQRTITTTLEKAVDVPVIGVFIVGTLLKLLLLPSYRSTDFEVHRNWLAITASLPRTEWYFDVGSEWTLDYPPFFAWFERFVGFFAEYVDPKILALTPLNYASTATIVFQRLSVIVSDILLYCAIVKYCNSWPRVTTTEVAFNTNKRVVVLLLTFLDAGLIMVDHVHFQYNGMLLGLLILSVAYIREGQDLKGALVYAILLMMKHIYLYVALLYFVYLFGHYCYTVPTKSKLKKRSLSNTDVHETLDALVHGQGLFRPIRFLTLGAIVLSVFGIAFASVIIGPDNKHTVVEHLTQIASRLFPVQRGLCHAYWAPNVWALYAFTDKILATIFRIPSPVGTMSGGLVQEATFVVLPNIAPIVCALLTLLAMTPVLRDVYKYPDPSLFMPALIYCMLCSYLFGYHVHEKAILQVTLPLGLVAAESTRDAKLYRIATIVGNISLFPLLFTTAEVGTRTLLTICHALLANVCLDPFHASSLKTRRIKYTGIGLTFLQQLYIGGLSMVAIVAMLLPFFLPRYPFLPLLMTSVSCAVGVIYVWIFALCQHYRKLDSLKTYLSGDKPPPPPAEVNTSRLDVF